MIHYPQAKGSFFPNPCYDGECESHDTQKSLSTPKTRKR